MVFGPHFAYLYVSKFLDIHYTDNRVLFCQSSFETKHRQVFECDGECLIIKYKRLLNQNNFQESLDNLESLVLGVASKRGVTLRFVMKDHAIA